jgi:alkanesulfonate monooxygenase SsuD/methylene tetrahydromethanopterin reductase-like flavin-dependent oxidoreductase (luciferase family)
MPAIDKEAEKGIGTMPKLKEIGLLVENVNARDYITQAQAAERLGFNSFWVPEDYAFPGAFSSAAARLRF